MDAVSSGEVVVSSSEELVASREQVMSSGEEAVSSYCLFIAVYFVTRSVTMV